MKEGTIEYRDAFRWGGEWRKDRVVKYRLSDDGVLTVVREGSCMAANPAPDAVEDEHYDETGDYSHSTWDRYESPFADLEFHTAILEDGFDFIAQGFFSGCKGLKKIIMTDSVKMIRPHFADNSPVEYLNEGGLLYLGTADNPHYFLVGCDDDYDSENLVIAEGTHYVSDGAFDGKTCIRGDISFPASLERLGELSFRGTSIKHLCIPDDGVGGWMSAFQSRYYIDDFHIRKDESLLESISVQYGLYEDYLKNKDTVGEDWWHRFVNCRITFRNPDGTTAAVLPPDPAPLFYQEINEIIDNEMYYEIEPGQVSGSDDVLADKLIYRNGKPVIPEEAGDDVWLLFSEGLAAVTQYGKWGFIDRTGKIVIGLQYDEVTGFRDGLAHVLVRGEGEGIIDRTGKVVVEPLYANVSDFENGMAWVRKHNSFGVVGRDGRMIVEPVYYDVRFTDNGYIKVREGDKWGLYDRTGKMIAEPQYSDLEIEEYIKTLKA